MSRNMAHNEASSQSSNGVRCACGECRAAGGELWRVCAAELAGAALLVLLTCLPACGATAAHSPFYRALASGLVVTVLVQSLDHISGAQMNPTVTLAAVLFGRVSRLQGAAMVAAQLLGATLGGGALQLLRPDTMPDLCVTLPVANLSLYKALCIEAVLGGCLALANCASWDARNVGLRDSWPLRIGICVAALSLVGGELTGASMNPVRSFGPALWAANWTHHWVYWVGPPTGSLVFTALYVALWPAPHDKPQRAL